VFIVSVIVSKVAQLSHLQFLHQMFSVSTLLLEDALKPATPLTNGAINETHFTRRHFKHVDTSSCETSMAEN